MNPDVLRRFAPFEDLDHESLSALAEQMRSSDFEKGDGLIRILEPVDRIMLLLDGLAALETVSVNGIRRIVWVFRPGELIGSRSLLEENVDDSEVRALTDGAIATISSSRLERIGETHPDVYLAVMRSLTERLQGMADRLLAATTLDVHTRLARLLLRFSGTDSGDPRNFRPLAYPMTHETLAEIVGASRPHISATLAELEEDGAVERGRGGKLTVRPDRLRVIAREEPGREISDLA